MKKTIITVVGQDTVGITAKGLYLPCRKQYQYFRHHTNHCRRIL